MSFVSINENDALKNEIITISNENTIADLKDFLNRRHRLNRANACFIYTFYVFQYAGIFITTFAAKYNNDKFIWVGVGLNLFASLIHSSININKQFSNQLMNDIKLIRSGNYVDESNLTFEPVTIQQSSSLGNRTQTSANMNINSDKHYYSSLHMTENPQNELRQPADSSVQTV